MGGRHLRVRHARRRAFTRGPQDLPVEEAGREACPPRGRGLEVLIGAAALAIGASLSWGSADFLGGTESRRHGAIRTAFWSQSTMLVVMWLLVLVLHVVMGLDVALRAVLLGALGGVVGVAGLVAFYRALAIGPMAIVPPITGAGVVIPVVVGLATGEPASMVVAIGIALAIAGIVLASSGELAASSGSEVRVTTRVLLLCLISAGCFSAIFLLLDAAAGSSIGDALVASAGVRIGGMTSLVALAIVTRTNPRDGITARDVARLARIGLLDTTATIAYAVASTRLELEVASVLASLYPAVTSLLAVIVLKERLSRPQVVGIAFALAGVVLLAGQR